MDCADEVTILRRELSQLANIQDIKFDILNGRILVTHESININPDVVIATVNRIGMRAEIYAEGRAFVNHGSLWQRWGRTALTALSGSFLIIGLGIHFSIVGVEAVAAEGHSTIPIVVRLFYFVSTVTGVWLVAPKAWYSLRRARPDMNLLMIIAVIGALVIGQWLEASSVAFLFAVSLALESWSVSRAKRAVAALMELAPVEARIIDDNSNELMVEAAFVSVGTRIIVKPGERIPLDGRIISGETSVNQAPITGESMPIERERGDTVLAGSINEEGAIEVETTKNASESTISKIIKIVEEAQAKRSPSEQWVEKFAMYYTPSVMVLAILVALFPPLVLGGQWMPWFYQALVLLVIACPCALVISTPVSIVSSLVAAARNGVLIKGGKYVELPAQIRLIAMDKTGTLTEGRPEVEKLLPLSGHNDEELLTIAAAIEMRSEHPLAQAIVRYAKEKGISPKPVEDYQALKGRGATATLNGRNVWVGSHRYLEERSEETVTMHDKLEQLSSGGRSVVVIGEEGHVCGFIALADKVRANARQTIAMLKHVGVEKVVLLSGDNVATAKLIGAQAGIDEVRAELLPEDKVRIIEELLGDYEKVAMVGDGINDAPALGRSSLGIAMGHGGTDVALESADIALMNDDLSRLPWLVSHSKRTLSTIRQNILVSLGVKAVFVLLAITGTASLWTAIAADMGVSLLVVGNALRLIREQKEG